MALGTAGEAGHDDMSDMGGPVRPGEAPRRPRVVGRPHAGVAARSQPVAAHDELGRRPFWQIALIYRAIGVLLVAGAMAVLPLGHLRWVVVAVTLLLAPTTLLVARAARRRGTLPLLPVYVSFALIVALVVAVPAVLAPALIIATANLAFLATTFGRRRAVIVLIVLTPIFGAVVVAAHPKFGYGSLLLWLFAGITTVAIVGEAVEVGSRMSSRYHSLVDRLDVVVWEGTADHIEFVNERVHALLGYPPEEFIGTGRMRRLIHADDRDVLEDHRHHVTLGQDHELCYRLRTAAGDYRWVIEQVSVEPRTDGPAKVRGVLVDVTDRMVVEEQAGQFADLFGSIRLGLAIVQLDDRNDDSSMRFVAANPALESFTTKKTEQMIGRRVVDFYPHFLTEGVVGGVADVIREGGRYNLGPLRITPLGRAERWVQMNAFAISGSSAAVTIEDVTEREEANLALRHQADHDELTGLPNRSMLNRRLTRAIEHAREHGEQVALLLMDLDQFKEVNDALGHHHGDRLLMEIGRRLVDSLPQAAIVARLGGDEFAVLLTGESLPLQAAKMAERVVDVLETAMEVDGVTLQTNVSVGVASYPIDARDAISLIQRADVAMYAAKRSISGVAAYVAEDDRSSVRRLTLLGELRRAIAGDELITHYQPIVDLARGTIVGAEALVRWRHPTLGLLQPSEFIELAEVSALIGPLVHIVAEQSVRDVATWIARGHRLSVTVNLSVRNLYDAQLGSWLLRLLERIDLPASALRVELTESALMDDPVLATSVLASLRARGTEVSIDDFGTGYSSLSMLRRLPVDELKIDKSFVQDLEQRDATLVRSIIDLGHALGLRVVAEGVESSRVLETLADLGCDRAQGYLIGKPLPADRFLDLVEQPPDHLVDLLASVATSPVERHGSERHPAASITRLPRRTGA